MRITQYTEREDRIISDDFTEEEQEEIKKGVRLEYKKYRELGVSKYLKEREE